MGLSCCVYNRFYLWYVSFSLTVGSQHWSMRDGGVMWRHVGMCNLESPFFLVKFVVSSCFLQVWATMSNFCRFPSVKRTDRWNCMLMTPWAAHACHYSVVVLARWFYGMGIDPTDTFQQRTSACVSAKYIGDILIFSSMTTRTFARWVPSSRGIYLFQHHVK